MASNLNNNLNLFKKTARILGYLNQVKYAAKTIVTSVDDFEKGQVNSLENYIGWLRTKIRSLDSIAESLTFELSQKEGEK